MKTLLNAMMISSCLFGLLSCTHRGGSDVKTASKFSELPPLNWPVNEGEWREHSACFKRYVAGHVFGFVWWQEDGGGKPSHGDDGALICSAKMSDGVFRRILKRHPWVREPVPQDLASTMHMPLEAVSRWTEHYTLNDEGRKMTMSWMRAMGGKLLVITLYYPDLKSAAKTAKPHN